MPEPVARTYSVVIADDLALVGEGLAALCEAQRPYRVIGQYSEGTAALQQIEAQRPDLAILDLNLPDLFTLEVVRRLRELGVKTKVVVLSTRRDRKTVVEALRCGASGFVLKSSTSAELLKAFEQVLEGGIYVSSQIELNKIFSPNHEAQPDDPLSQLSAREYQVFSLLVEGIRTKEIALRLALSPKTIDTYKTNLMRRLGVDDVEGLVHFAIDRTPGKPS